MIDLTPIPNDPPLQTLVAQLRDLIRDARSRALRSVDAIQVRTCWEISGGISWSSSRAGRRALNTVSGCCRDWRSR